MCPWRCVLSKITLVLMLPSAMVSFLLIFILSMGEFSVANFLRYDIFPMESFIQFSAFYDFRTATLYAMPLLAIVLVILGIESLLFKKEPSDSKAGQRGSLFPCTRFRYRL